MACAQGTHRPPRLVRSHPSPPAPGPPRNLRAEYRRTPLGIDVERPRLSWVVVGTRRGAVQAAYRIQVASSPECLARGEADVWDSGKVESSQSIQVPYGGPPLQSGRRYWWRVRTWNAAGEASTYSEATWWEMGLLAAEDWQGVWIASREPLPEQPEGFYEKDPAPLFRKAFSLERTPERARLYVSGLGYYEARLNGEKVGDRVLDPGWTNYADRVYYSTYDVTDLLQKGPNALGVMLGNGWYNPLPLRMFGQYNFRQYLTVGKPRLIAQLVVEYADGSREVIASDTTWRVGKGPILKNSVYLGEYYDARREQPGWAAPGFDAEGWTQSVRIEPPGGALRWQPQPPIKVTGILQPVAITEPAPDTFIVDFGQNFAGWVRMRVEGPRGTKVKLRYGELLREDGTLNGLTTVAGHIKEMWGLGGGPGAPPTAWQEDVYVLSGEGEETFRPHFTFHGFRYVRVTGYPGTPTLDDFTGLRLSADLRPAGTFASSSELLNRIQEMTRWTFLSNVFSIQSDCPAREKLAYGGDIVVAGDAFLYNFQMGGFYTKAVRDFEADQRPNGGMPETAPYVGIAVEGYGGGSGPIGWQLAHPFLQMRLYRFYGDERIIREQYPATLRTVAFLRAQAGDDHLLLKGISDHASIDPKPVALTSTAFYYRYVRLLAQFADILGRAQDAREYRALADEIKAAFLDRFFHPHAATFGTHTQAAQLFALYYDLVPPEKRNEALDVLITDIEDIHDGHLSTGIFGTTMLFDVLRRYGRDGVAYRVATQQDFPGWGYMLENGATTLWEFWRGGTQASHNHPMFGSISEWFYRSLAGINPAPGAVGFDEIVIAPCVVGDLAWVKASYDSIRGEIASHWRLEDGGLMLDVTIPANTTAEVHVPLLEIEAPTIRESGDVLVRAGEAADATAPAVEFLRMDEEAAVFAVGSGTYHFEVDV